MQKFFGLVILVLTLSSCQTTQIAETVKQHEGYRVVSTDELKNVLNGNTIVFYTKTSYGEYFGHGGNLKLRIIYRDSGITFDLLNKWAIKNGKFTTGIDFDGVKSFALYEKEGKYFIDIDGLRACEVFPGDALDQVRQCNSGQPCPPS